MPRITNRVFFGACLICLTASLTLKYYRMPGENPAPMQDRFRRFLAEGGFEKIDTVQIGDFQFVSSTAVDCTLYVAEVSPQGWEREIIRQITPSEAQTAFIFRGKVYTEQPVLATRIDYWSTRALRFTGWKVVNAPVLAIVASRACDLNQFPWSSVRTEDAGKIG